LRQCPGDAMADRITFSSLTQMEQLYITGTDVYTDKILR